MLATEREGADRCILNLKIYNSKNGFKECKILSYRLLNMKSNNFKNFKIY